MSCVLSSLVVVVGGGVGVCVLCDRVKDRTYAVSLYDIRLPP